MTFETILDVENILGGVYACDLGLLVLVAIVAGVDRIAAGVAHLARGLIATMIEWEGMPNQTRRTPARRRMTRGARGTELSSMYRWFGVALGAISRRAAKAIVDVALGASQLRVFAVERKNRRVIESL